VAGCILSLVICGFGPNPVQAAPKARGEIRQAEGTVELFSHDFPDRGWKRVNAGQDLYEGDFLRTGSRDSSARVTLYSASGQDTIDIAPDTLLELPIPHQSESARTQLTDAFIELKEGIVRWWTGNEATPEVDWPSAFNIRTPTVVAGSRDSGTDGAVPGLRKVRHWETVLVLEDDDTAIFTKEGAINVATPTDDSPIPLGEGQKVIATTYGIGTVGSFSEDEWRAAVANLPDRPPADSATGCDDASGSWTQTHSAGTSTWVLARTGTGTYQAEEHGLGNAKGTASLNGKTLRIDFRTAHASPFVGYYLWDLDPGCTSGKGKVYQTDGPLKGRTFDCTVSRVK
jgi:hypothetical protein